MLLKSLSDYETGKVIPSDEALELLADALKFPIGFFFKADVEEPLKDAVSFRSQRAMTASQRNAALAAGALAFELDNWIDERFELARSDLPDLRDQEPEQAALSLRNAWGIGIRPIGNMVHLLEAKGIRVFSLAEQSKRVDAYSVWYRETPFVFLNTMKTSEHSRMDAAHELGHLVMHQHGAVSGRDVEKDAQAFGAAFLMPESSVLGVVPRLNVVSIAQLAAIKQNWGVSVAALAKRLHQLGLISEWSYRGVFIELGRYGRSNEPFPMAREMSQVFDQVFGSLKVSGTSKSTAAEQLMLFTEDIEALTFGLTTVDVIKGKQAPDSEADAMRRKLRVV